MIHSSPTSQNCEKKTWCADHKFYDLCSVTHALLHLMAACSFRPITPSCMPLPASHPTQPPPVLLATPWKLVPILLLTIVVAFSVMQNDSVLVAFSSIHDEYKPSSNFKAKCF